MTFSFPLSLTIMLSNFKSRWHTDFECICLTAVASCLIQSFAYSSFGGPTLCCSSLRSELPDMYSYTSTTSDSSVSNVPRSLGKWSLPFSAIIQLISCSIAFLLRADSFAASYIFRATLWWPIYASFTTANDPLPSTRCILKSLREKELVETGATYWCAAL